MEPPFEGGDGLECLGGGAGEEGLLAARPLLLQLPQLDPPDLPAPRLRQLADELDLARVLVGRGHALAVFLQLGGKRARAVMTRPEDDERFHDLPAVRIRLPD